MELEREHELIVVRLLLHLTAKEQELLEAFSAGLLVYAGLVRQPLSACSQRDRRGSPKRVPSLSGTVP